MEDKILEILLASLNNWGIYALFLMTFLEAALLIGVFVPGESMVVIAGIAASRGVLDITDVVWVSALGAILGDSAGYLIGTRFGETVFKKYGKILRIKEARIAAYRRFFERHGGKTVFAGRFTSVLRALAPLLAGMSRMSYPRFLFYNITGGILWAAGFSLLGYFAGNSWGAVKPYFTAFGKAGALSMLSAVAIYLLYNFIKKRVNEKEFDLTAAKAAIKNR